MSEDTKTGKPGTPITLSDEARVRAEELSRQRHHQAVKMVTTLTHSVEAYAALVRELVGGLKEIVEECHNGGYPNEIVATRMIERIDEQAQALILRTENQGSSRADSAALLAPQANCSAAQSLDGGEG